jgi:hypothetical protein
MTWPTWMILLLSFLGFIPILKDMSENPSRLSDIRLLDSSEPKLQIIFVVLLIIVALAEAVGSILLKHYLLNEPFKRGTFDIDKAKGRTRFLIVHVINWIIACLIAGGGLVFAVVTKRID